MAFRNVGKSLLEIKAPPNLGSLQSDALGRYLKPATYIIKNGS